MINSYQEALKILELNSNSSEEEIKKSYKRLARKYHPDVNKDSEAENKYKEVCAAYEFVKNNQEPSLPFNYFQVEDILRNFDLNPEIIIPNKRKQPLTQVLELSFEESILGASKSITISYADKCHTCYSKGFTLHETCPKCEGKGFHQYINNRIHHHISCNSCRGSGKEIRPCQDCFSENNIKTITKEIRIPGGLISGTQVRLKECGNYFNNHREDAFLILKIAEHPTMKLIKNKVHSDLQITLLEALEGTTKEVETVLGKACLNIPVKTKHLDQVILPNYGINRQGDHIFTVKIEYPTDINLLIEYLKTCQ